MPGMWPAARISQGDFVPVKIAVNQRVRFANVISIRSFDIDG